MPHAGGSGPARRRGDSSFREPDRDQCEVALRALAACLDPEELAARSPAREYDFSPPPMHYEEPAEGGSDLKEAGGE